MKKILRSLLLSLMFLLPTQLFAQTLIAGWDFQTTTNTPAGTAATAAPNSPLVYVANVGAGTLYLDGTNGSSTWTSLASNPQVTSFTGSTVNVSNGLATTGACLALANNSANGFGIVFKVATTGIKSLAITYSTQASATGFSTQLWQYSTDGTTWTTLATVGPRGYAASTFATAGVITLPPIVDLNASTTYIKMIVNGASASSGNCRLDNVQILTGPTVYYSNNSGDLGLASTYNSSTDGTSGSAPSDLIGTGNAVYEIQANRTTYALTGDLTIGTLIFPPAVNLNLAGHTLTMGSSTGGGTFIGSATSSLVVTGTANIGFASGAALLQSLTVNATGNNTATITSAFNVPSNGSTTITIPNGVLNGGGLLTLKSDATGTASIGTVSSAVGAGATNIIAERYIADKRAWRLVGVPLLSTQTINAAWQEGAASVSSDPAPGFGTFIIGSSTANGFDIASTSGSLLAYSASAFSSVANTTTVLNSTANAGYFLFSIGNRSVDPTNSSAHSATTLRTTGAVRTGSQAAVAVAATGYTLVNNPYPSAVDFSLLTRSATVQNQFYTWDSTMGSYGGYVLVSYSGGTYTSVPSSTLGKIIPSGAAVFVQADGTTAGTLTFTEAAKVSTATAGSFSTFATSVAAANGNSHDFRVNLTDASLHLVDGVMASFAPGYSNNVDLNDAPKLANFYENMSLSRAGQQLTLERRSDITANDTLFIQLSGVKATSYQLQIDPSAFNESGMIANLEDAYLHTSTKLDLSQVSNIPFTTTADAASYNNRFIITFVPAKPSNIISVQTPNNAGARVIAYPNPATGKQINLTFEAMPVGTYNITVVNTFGQVMQKNTMDYNGTSANKLLSANYTTGVYTVNVQAAGFNQSIKVIVP